MVTQTAGDIAHATARSRLLSSPVPALLLVGAAALLVRLLLLWRYPFDGLYGVDAYFYLTATRDLVKTWTDPPRLWDWLTVWGTPPVSVWPLDYHLQMALVGAFTGLNAGAGQAISLIAGTLTPVLTSILTLQISDFGYWILEPQGRAIQYPISNIQYPKSAAALLAGLVVAFSALAVRASLVVMADMAGLFWATLGVVLAVRYLTSTEYQVASTESAKNTRYSLLGTRYSVLVGLAAGICLGVASVTRYIYPLLLLPILLFAVLSMRPRESGPLWRAVVVRMLPVAAPVVVLVSLQLLHNWAHPMPGLPSPVIGTWNPANAFQSQFESQDGQQSHNWPMGFFFLARPLLSPDALGLALLPLLVLGVVALVRARAGGPAGLLLGWWLLFAGFYSGNIYQADRFILSYLPPMAVLAGIGFGWTLRRFWILDFGFWTVRSQSKIQNPKSKIAWVACFGAVGLCVVGLAVSAYTARADFRGLYLGKEDYLRAARCAQAAVGGSVLAMPVFSSQVTFTLREYTGLAPRDLYYETPDSIDAAIGRPVPVPSGARAYLILPLQDFEKQWGNTPTGAAYHHLRDAYRLEERVCPNSSFTLFEVR